MCRPHLPSSIYGMGNQRAHMLLKWIWIDTICKTWSPDTHVKGALTSYYFYKNRHLNQVNGRLIRIFAKRESVNVRLFLKYGCHNCNFKCLSNQKDNVFFLNRDHCRELLNCIQVFTPATLAGTSLSSPASVAFKHSLTFSETLTLNAHVAVGSPHQSLMSSLYCVAFHSCW